MAYYMCPPQVSFTCGFLAPMAFTQDITREQFVHRCASLHSDLPPQVEGWHEAPGGGRGAGGAEEHSCAAGPQRSVEGLYMRETELNCRVHLRRLFVLHVVGLYTTSVFQWMNQTL